MNTTEVLSYVDLLEDNLDGLEESLKELLPSESLAEASKKLPLLDRAKLHVTVVYAIESLLFSYLRVHNISPHSHPVFKELARVKSYFDKIKEIENAPPPGSAAAKRDLSLDRQAAGRIIKHALAGNNKIDLEAAERKAKEALLAKRKLRELEKNLSLSESDVQTPVPSTDPAVPLSSYAAPMAVEWEGSEEGEIDEGEVEQVHVPAEVQTPTKGKKKDKKSKKEKKRQRGAERGASGTPKTKRKRKHSSMGAVQAGS